MTETEVSHKEMKAMSEVIRELSDGEEMVIEGGASSLARYRSDDPRDRALETRRPAFEPPYLSESSQC